MVLHEIGTNARKHSALSDVTRLDSDAWPLQAKKGRRSPQVWRESGGPPVSAPTTQGFGSTLIENSLRAYNGDVTLSYAETGVVCEINLPLPVLQHPIGALARDANQHGAAQPQQRYGLEGRR